AAPLLIDIVAPARHVRVVADHNIGASARRRTVPAQMRVAVARQLDAFGRIRHGKSVFARNGLTVGKTRAGDLHGFPPAVTPFKGLSDRSRCARASRAFDYFRNQFSRAEADFSSTSLACISMASGASGRRRR